MSFADTVSADYKVPAHDDGESVTFAAVRASGTTSYSLTYVVAHELTVDEMAAAGLVVGKRAKLFVLPNAQITVAADKPQAGDRITDGGSLVWNVVDATLDDLGIAWNARAVQQR